jgi:peptide/nickel transport system substrate-binding protein
MRKQLIVAFVALLLGATACGDDTDNADTEATTSTASTTGAVSSTPTTLPPDVCTTDRTGGTVTFGEFIAPTSLDPASTTGAKGVIGGAEDLAIYAALMRYDPASGKFEPWVAQSLTANANASEWTLKLRSGVVFGNGDPLTAAAVKASIQRIGEPALRSSNASFLANIADMAVIDDTTLVFKLAAPWGSFPTFLAGEGGMIVNTKVATALGAGFATMPKGAGVGPYEPMKFTPSEEIVLQAKANWWGGPVCIQQLRFIRLNGAQVTYDALKAGTVDVAFLREPVPIAQARDDKFSVFVNPQNAGAMLFINNRPNAPGSDLRVRQAIALSIDPAAINQRGYGGKGAPTSALIGPKSVWYSGLTGTAYDPVKAKQTLQQVLGEGKYNGTLRLLCPDTPSSRDIALTIETQLTVTGFKVNTTFMPTITAAMNDGNFDTACNGMNLSDNAPDIALSQQFTTRGSARTAFKNPEFDAAVERLKAANTESAIKVALKDVQDLWNQQIPSVVFGVTDEAIATSAKVKGLRYTQDTNVIFDKAYLAK